MNTLNKFISDLDEKAMPMRFIFGSDACYDGAVKYKNKIWSLDISSFMLIRTVITQNLIK